jgi:hypothetical protein
MKANHGKSAVSRSAGRPAYPTHRFPAEFSTLFLARITWMEGKHGKIRCQPFKLALRPDPAGPTVSFRRFTDCVKIK